MLPKHAFYQAELLPFSLQKVHTFLLRLELQEVLSVFHLPPDIPHEKLYTHSSCYYIVHLVLWLPSIACDGNSSNIHNLLEFGVWYVNYTYSFSFKYTKILKFGQELYPIQLK